MRAGNGDLLQAEVASVLDWWTLAGVAFAADERPRDWLAPPARPAPAAADTPAVAVPDALPGTLDDFLAWFTGGGDPALLGPADARVAPAGNRAASLMVIIDMPTPDDIDAGSLMSGPAGRLLDRMLAAMGTSRDAAWLAPLCPARPAGGRIAPDRLARLGRIALHHAGLIGAKNVLLMGAPTAEAVLGEQIGSARGRIHDRQGRQLVATFSPQILLGQPAMKAGAWADLQTLMEGERQ